MAQGARRLPAMPARSIVCPRRNGLSSLHCAPWAVTQQFQRMFLLRLFQSPARPSGPSTPSSRQCRFSQALPCGLSLGHSPGSSCPSPTLGRFSTGPGPLSLEDTLETKVWCQVNNVVLTEEKQKHTSKCRGRRWAAAWRAGVHACPPAVLGRSRPWHTARCVCVWACMCRRACVHVTEDE